MQLFQNSFAGMMHSLTLKSAPLTGLRAWTAHKYHG